MDTRRKIVLGIGGALALVGSGIAWRVMSAPKTAYLPWRMPPEPDLDPRLDAFRYAILAPNPHNRQPWQIRLVGDNEAELSCDLSKRLPQTDPFDRQIVIGFGCFIALAAIAATRRGLRVDVDVFPDGAGAERLDARPIARLRFVADPEIKPDPLAALIADRRSSKVPFDSARPVPEDAWQTLKGAATGSIRLDRSGSEADTNALRALAIAAFEREVRTPHTLGESIDVLRVGSREIDASPDGIPLTGPLFEALSLLGADRVRADARDPKARSTENQIEKYRKIFEATPDFVWLVAQGNSRADQVAVGRSYARLNLLATGLGLGMHPVSQALQEYPEMAPLFSEARRLCRVGPDETLQMLARIGYAAPVPPAPRWPLEAKLIRA